MSYTDTGSRVSGDGYGYSIIKGSESLPCYFNPGEFYPCDVFGVRLVWRGIARIVWTGAQWSDASDAGERFANMGRRWRIHTERARALAHGIGVIG